MAITRLSGGVTPGDGADPRTFPAIWNATADVLDDAILPSGGSAGQVLVKDSATDFDAVWGDRRSLFVPGSGLYFKTPGTHPNVTLTQDRVSYIAVEVGACTVDRMLVQVQTAAASSTVRLGIYESDSAGYPGDLLLDAGTVDSTTTGQKEITISETLKPGRYWLAGVAQGGTPTLTGVSVNYLFGLGYQAQLAAGPSTANFFIWNASTPFQTGVSGALPATANPTWDFGSANGIQIGLRVA